MKRTTIILFLIFCLCSCSKGLNNPDETPSFPDKDKIHVLTPDSRGRLDMNSDESEKILPGDIIYLRGNFLSVRITGLKGTAEQPIHITNYPEEKLIVGDPDWSGGAYSSALQLLECRHIILGGEKESSNFLIDGSIVPKARASYFGINLRPFTDNIEVKNIIIRNGGIGITAKTDPVKDDPTTWYPNTLLENLSIHDLDISDTEGEAMYIGHTSLWWGWDENGKGYNAGAKPENPAHTFVRPIIWKNVRIYNNHVSNTGYDGIQASAIDRLEIYGNEIANFGLKQTSGQCMGLIVGGHTTNTYVHDNYVHDGFGELFQFHGSGENNATHIVRSNLFKNSHSNGIGIYGATDAATIDISDNTVMNCYSFAVQANGKYYKTLVKLHDNTFISCNQQDTLSHQYIRIMNNAIVEENNNKQY
ncbi:right-handed parallel beta-helix repeat-containing protein [Parabacteroides sp.]